MMFSTLCRSIFFYKFRIVGGDFYYFLFRKKSMPQIQQIIHLNLNFPKRNNL